MVFNCLCLVDLMVKYTFYLCLILLIPLFPKESSFFPSKLYLSSKCRDIYMCVCVEKMFVDPAFMWEPYQAVAVAIWRTSE